MFSSRHNYHHSKVPEIGTLHRFNGRKLIVEAYPFLSDCAYPYSLGFHCVHVRYLDNGHRAKIAGHYLTVCDGYGFSLTEIKTY